MRTCDAMLARVSGSALVTSAMSHELIRALDDVVIPEVTKTMIWEEDPRFGLGDARDHTVKRARSEMLAIRCSAVHTRDTWVK